jgi:hypothetical protein
MYCKRRIFSSNRNLEQAEVYVAALGRSVQQTEEAALQLNYAAQVRIYSFFLSSPFVVIIYIGNVFRKRGRRSFQLNFAVQVRGSRALRFASGCGFRFFLSS